MSSWIPTSFHNNQNNKQPPSKRKKLTYTKSKSFDDSKFNAKKNGVTFNINSTNWIENFHPESETDLAVHTKKIQECKEWLRKAISSRKNGNVLLLTGPTGSGKTATIKVLCKDLGLTLNEWVTPVDSERFVENSYSHQEYRIVERQSDVFLNFLLKASRYNSLFDNDCKGRVVLVEDFPNYLIRNPDNIETVLGKYQEWGKSPLIFICTDTSGKEINIGRNLFTDAICEQFQIDHISFNPIAMTGMKNALKRAVAIMSTDPSYKVQSSETIDAIIYSSIGDVRSALNNLRFSSLKDSCSLPMEPVVEQQAYTTKTPKGSTKTRSAKQKCSKLKNMGRDETLGLLHGVGRVMNPKRVVTPFGYTFSHPIEETVESFLSMPKVFLSFLHQNYPPHFRSIEDVLPAADCLSLADQISEEWRASEISEYALWIAIGGLLIHNLEPVKLWAPVRAPKKLQIKIPSHKELSLDVQHIAHKRTLAMDYKTYCNIIKPTLKDDIQIEDDEVVIEM